MKVAIKLVDSYRRNKRGWHASSRIRGHFLAKYWDELDDIFYPEDFKQEYNEFHSLKNQLKILKDYEYIILHKTYDYKLAKALALRGHKLILDLSDPDFLLGFSDINRAGMCYLTMTNCTAIVINNYLIETELIKGTDKPIFYIPDRIDLEAHQPQKIIHREQMTDLVWFGHSDNHKSILPYLDELRGYNLKVISDRPIAGAEFVQWNPETANQEIVKADCVILGQHPDEIQRWKSCNRRQTAYALKMPVVYTPDQLERMKDVKNRIKDAENGFKYVIKNDDIRISVRQWRNLLTKI